MRQLVQVPLIHDPWTEMHCAPFLHDRRITVPHDLEQLFRTAYDHYWDGIDSALSPIAIHRVYQDGMAAPQQGRTWDEILAYIPQSRNVQTLRRLVAKGAILEPAEDAAVQQKALHATVQGSAADAAGLLQQRDMIIASNIARTLQDGETGVLFIGGLHQVLPLLAESQIVTMAYCTDARTLLSLVEQVWSVVDPQLQEILRPYDPVAAMHYIREEIDQMCRRQ
jgi:hypothetical protein